MIYMTFSEKSDRNFKKIHNDKYRQFKNNPLNDETLTRFRSDA